MGRKWTTKDQENFLNGWGPGYKQASEKKNYLFFWDELFSAWFVAFPEPVPTEVVNIAPELWSPEQQETAQKGILQRKAQLRDWFRNHMRPDCRVDSPGYINKLVKLHEQKNTGTRSRKATEVYSTRFYQGSDTQKTVQERLRDEAPRNDAGELIKETKGEKSRRRMKIYGTEITEAWKLATEEQTSEVLTAMEESRARREVEEDDEPTPDDQQEGLRRLPHLMDVAAKEMHDTSGWYFTILSGGRGATGMVQTASFHLGKTRNGIDFEHAYSDFNDVVMRPWTSFVRNLCGESGDLSLTPSGAGLPTEGNGYGQALNQGSVEPVPPTPPLQEPQSGDSSDGTPRTSFANQAQFSDGSDAARTSPDPPVPPTPPLQEPIDNLLRTSTDPPQSGDDSDDTARTSTDLPQIQDDGPVRAEPDAAQDNGCASPPPENTHGESGTVSGGAATENNKTLRTSQGLRPDSWLEPAVERLRCTVGADWLEAIDLWVGIEKSQPGGSKQHFPMLNRPPQVARWFAYGRIPTVDPEISNIEQYEQDVLAWWLYLQPEWRNSTGPLPLALYHAPEGSDWSTLKVTGFNGLLIVMLVFAWWGQAVGTTPAWLAASADLKHALKALANEGEEADPVPWRPTTKRHRDAGSGKENAASAGKLKHRRKQAETVPPTRATRSSTTRTSRSGRRQ